MKQFSISPGSLKIIPTGQSRMKMVAGFQNVFVIIFVVVGLFFAGLTGCEQEPPDNIEEEETDTVSLPEVDLLYVIAGNGAAKLNWINPGWGPLNTEISWIPEGEAVQTVGTSIEDTIVSGLTNGITYNFLVKTVDPDSGGKSTGITVSCTPVFQKMVGGNNSDELYSIYPTSDSGFIMAGYSMSTDLPFLLNNGGKDVYVVKMDSNWDMEWQKLHGSINDDIALCVQQTIDGGYFIAGRWRVITGEPDKFYALKLDADGNRTWERAMGGNGYDIAYTCQQIADGGYIVAGESSSTDIPGLTYIGNVDIYLVKLDSSGATSWQKMYGGNGWDRVFSIQQTSDDGYILAGMSYSFDLSGQTHNGQDDFYLLKLDSNGDFLWQKQFGGSNWDSLNFVQQTVDGGYIIAGDTNSTDIPGLDLIVTSVQGSMYPPAHRYLAKCDSNGDIVWQKIFGVSNNWSIRETSDGGFIVVDGNYDVCFIKLDSNGDIVSEFTFAGTVAESAGAVLEVSSGVYIAVGSSESTDIPNVPNEGGFDGYFIIKD
jgi:hypothetical protein